MSLVQLLVGRLAQDMQDTVGLGVAVRPLVEPLDQPPQLVGRFVAQNTNPARPPPHEATPPPEEALAPTVAVPLRPMGVPLAPLVARARATHGKCTKCTEWTVNTRVESTERGLSQIGGTLAVTWPLVASIVNVRAPVDV